MAEAGADAGPIPPEADLTHDERVEAIRRAVQEEYFPDFADSPPPESQASVARPEDSHHASPPSPKSDPAADGEPRDLQNAGGARDPWDAPVADLRRRGAATAIGPHDPAFCPREWREPG